MFSSRLPASVSPTPLSERMRRARHEGRVRFDLTETNPTVVGLDYPAGLTDVFADGAWLTYGPAPLGSQAARQAVAAALAPRIVDPGRLMLTASTSEAYAFLFKLLCDPGDEVLVPRPSYPLFDVLTALEAVTAVTYPLDPTGGWCLDRAALERALSPRTRAVLLVSPNNPTGTMIRDDDREWLAALAGERRLAIVADEVFVDYQLGRRPATTSLLDEHRVLTFVLGGLSKRVGLPQLKLAWTVVNGPDDDVRQALTRLELIADSYLSVASPIQTAAAAVLDHGRVIQRQIQDRLRHNLDHLMAVAVAHPALTIYPPDGGWSVVLRVPAILSEDQWVERLLDDGVLVHPGYFFDIDIGVHLVISLLPAPPVFAAGVAAIAARVGERS